MQRTKIDKDYELFFYVCQFPLDLSHLHKMENWRERCDKAAVLILETWSSKFEKTKEELGLLDKFDHVFVLNQSSIPNLTKYTKSPCSFLSVGTDCLLASPFPNAPNRTIDVYSMGRRSQTTHEQLLRLASDGDIFYVYDTTSHGHVLNWTESRLMTSSLIKRSRYFIAYDHSIGNASKLMESRHERALSTRYFEGAAGGAVVLGSKPDCPEFLDYFDWPDAVIEIPAAPEDMREILRDLDAQPERLARVSKLNAINSLRRHDWVHRWLDVLRTMNMEISPRSLLRIEELNRVADAADESSRPHVANRYA